jgi:pyruvate,orthophosphate dikinase
MDKKFVSSALEANLAETRYKDIEIPDKYKWFINLSKKYYGINKRANDCIVEFQHPFSNRKFVIDQLREILLTDYWFYSGRDEPEKAFDIPLELMKALLFEGHNTEHHVMIIRTLLEFADKLVREGKDYSDTFRKIYYIFLEGFEHDEFSFIVASKYFKRYLKNFGSQEIFRLRRLELTKKIFNASLRYWQQSSNVEKWLEQNKKMLASDINVIIKKVGKPWFEETLEKAEKIESWSEFIEKIPDYDNIADRFSDTIELFDTFIEKFYFIFYLLQIPGMRLHNERLIWRLNEILVQTIDEVKKQDLKGFIDQIFHYAYDLRKTHISSILDTFLTLGKKIIDLDDTETQEYLRYFEDKLIEFGFETPGMVFVNEDWQLSVNPNHIKNIRIWLELIEYTQSGLERLLSTLIVNLKLGGIFISDTDLFQRDITKILNSNVAPHYKKVKQLTRIFPVYFNEIGAEGEIRHVTTTMDELNYRQDKLIHFLRKQVHTESNNTLIELTKKIFRFWYDGNLEALKDTLPENVYSTIDLNNEYYAPIHKMVVKLCEMTNKTPDELLAVELDEIDSMLEKLKDDNNKDKERIRNMVALYAFLKEKYSFDTVDIIVLLKRYNYIEENKIEQLKKALDNDNFEMSLKLIYSFMEKLKEIIFDPKPSKSWENIYHKRHIAVGIPSMYGIYREPKFEAMGLTFRLEKVATRLMEKVVQIINLDYISAKTLKNIYTILDYFREGLNLDGVTNQSFNSNLMMLKYSLSSQSFSFYQYINIFQFLAEDVKRTIIKYFLKTYDLPLKIVIPQLYNPDGKLSKKEEMTLINKVSEEFYRDVIAEAFLMQPLDNFVARILGSLRSMNDNLKPEMISEIMSYNSDLVISSLDKHDSRIDNQTFLGSKAYHLKNLMLHGFPVPQGFVLTTEVFRRHAAITGHENLRKEMHDMIRKHIRQIEKKTKMQLGNPDNPLLLSVRSGTAISMPGAMDTFLNVGMNDKITETIAKDKNKAWAAWDSYRRFLQSWGMAYGLERDDFDDIMLSFKEKYNIKLKTDFTPNNMRELAYAYKQKLKENNIVFIEDIFEQLITTINLVFTSWNSERAKVYREHLQIADEWGTAVIVQQMVFGNKHLTSGTGVVFTQNPQAQRQSINLYGDYTTRSQGEDIVAGLVKPLPVNVNQVINGDISVSLEKRYPLIYKRIYEIADELVNRLGYSPQEIEFTFESDNPEDLYILQIRDMDMAKSRSFKIFRTKPDEMKIAGRGIGIGGGAMNGRVAFDDKDMELLRKKYPDENIILIRPDTVPDDIGMIFETDGLLTARGGATSHAAVTAVRLGKTAIVNCSKLSVFEDEKFCILGIYRFITGDKIAIDGSLGNIYKGYYPIENEEGYESFKF